MADITENHITAAELGGVAARSILAAEANFATTALDIVNKEKSLTTCKLTVNHVATPTDEKVPFVDQWWTFTGVDGAKFDGTYQCTAVTINSATQTIIHYTHAVSESVGSAAISITGGAVPTYAFGIATASKFGLNNSLSSASDSTANKNQVMMVGRRVVYYTNLSNASSAFTSDTFSSSMVYEYTIYGGTNGTSRPDFAPIFRQSGGANDGDFLLVMTGNNYQQVRYYDSSGGTWTIMTANTDYTGTGTALSNSTKYVIKVEAIVENSKLVQIRVTSSGAEIANYRIINSTYQIATPFYVGDACLAASDVTLTHYVVDAITLRLT